MNKKIWALALTTLVAAGALAGCSGGGSVSAPVSTVSGEGGVGSSEAPAAEAEPAGPTVGVPFEVKQNEGTAKVTIVSASYGPTLGGDFDIAATNGGYLILDVLWEASEGVANSNPLYIKAKDAAGVAGEIAIGVPTALGSGEVPLGDKSSGNVAFDIGAGPYTVVVTNQILQEEARLTVDATPR